MSGDSSESTDRSWLTSSTAEPSNDPNEVQIIFEKKLEYIFNDTSHAYTSCEARAYDKRFHKSHKQLCDVYQQYNVQYDRVNQDTASLHQFIQGKVDLCMLTVLMWWMSHCKVFHGLF